MKATLVLAAAGVLAARIGLTYTSNGDPDHSLGGY